MLDSPKTIPRVAPKAYDYAKEVLDFGFHKALSWVQQRRSVAPASGAIQDWLENQTFS